MKSNVTFVLFAKNEERRIVFPLKNFSEFGDVVILDGGSTDKTQELAEAMGARFLLRPNITSANVENTENLEFIKKHITTDWIYWGYVDNVAPLSLVKKMVEILRKIATKK